MTNKPTRNIEESLWIAAPPDDVWNAFTRAEEIVNWFALRSESKPGVGGYIGLGWDLKDQEPGRCRITDWRENEYLRMTWRDDPGGEHELPVELWLEGKDGGTLLKLVHSGFLSEASWDDEYDAHRRGWEYELRSLKYYLENYPGRRRRHALKIFKLEEAPAAVYPQVVGPDGAFRIASADLDAGRPVNMTLPDGTATSGTVIYRHPGSDFVATADVLDGGMFRVSLDRVGGETQLWVWAFSWTAGEDRVRALIEPVFDAIEGRLAVPA